MILFLSEILNNLEAKVSSEFKTKINQYRNDRQVFELPTKEIEYVYLAYQVLDELYCDSKSSLFGLYQFNNR